MMRRGVFALKDRHGNDLHFGHGGDVWCVPAPGIDDFRDQLKKIRHLELMDGDVILASFPRSGTCWHHQMLLMLLNETTDHIGNLNDYHLDWCPFEKLRRPDTPRLYSTHLGFRFLPEQVKEKKVKVIYVYRNPKDNWVSLYNYAHGIAAIPSYEGTWSHFFDLMMGPGYWLGDWFDHVLDFENAARENPDLVFFSCYELMKKDPVGQIMKLNQFLGLNRGRGLCEQIAHACKFSTLKAAQQAKHLDIFQDDRWKKGAPGIYRKGEIGDWKNWFTVAQSDQLDTVFKKRMSESQLPFFFQ